MTGYFFFFGGGGVLFFKSFPIFPKPLILNSSFSRFYVESEGHSIVEAVWSEALNKSSINLAQ